MSDPEQLAGKDQPAFSLDDEPISKAYREGAAEAVKMYADEARRLLTSIDEKACHYVSHCPQDGNSSDQKTKKLALYGSSLQSGMHRAQASLLH